jgi:hypothetical protein
MTATSVGAKGRTGRPRFSVLAVVALAWAILGLAPIALVIGYIAKRRVDESGGQLRGRGLAVASMVVSAGMIAAVALWFGLALVGYLVRG